jgi:hypothetical protein
MAQRPSEEREVAWSDSGDALVAATPDDNGVARADGDRVVSTGPATDEVVSATAIDPIVAAVAANDDVGAAGAFEDGRPGLVRGVQRGVRCRLTVAEPADASGRMIRSGQT